MQIIGIIIIVLLVVIIFCLDHISKIIPNTNQISNLLEEIGGAKEKDYSNSYGFKKLEEEIINIKIILEKFTQIDIDSLKKELFNKKTKEDLIESKESLKDFKKELSLMEAEYIKAEEKEKEWMQEHIEELKGTISYTEQEIEDLEKNIN